MSEEELWLHLETEIGKNQLLAKINKAIETLEEQERHIKEADKEIERLKEDNEYLNKVNIELSAEKNRLNNIINELEKWLDKKEKLTFNSWNKGIHEVQRKLQELKGRGSNE